MSAREDRTHADRLRGHDFYPSVEALDSIPRLYATEKTPLAEKVVWLHYFVGACDWYVMELGEDRRIAFGWADMGDPQNAELGYVDLVELRGIVVKHPMGFEVAVERDLHWKPVPFGQTGADGRRGR